MLEFKKQRKPIDIKEVEPIEEILKRFGSGSMVHGALSAEAHETLAVGSMRLYNAAITGAAVQVVCVTADGTTILYFNEVRDNNSDLPCQATNDGYYMFNITYRTSS